MSAIAQVQDQAQKVGFKHIVFATDFSTASERALAHALAISHQFGSRLSIVHALPPEPREPLVFDPPPPDLDRGRPQAEKEMGRLANEARIRDLDFHIAIERGEVWEVLSSIIQQEDADLLVMGTHGRGGLKKLALGSIAEEVLRQAACPVLTIGPKVPPADAEKIECKTILFATDFGPGSMKALPYALSLARDCEARLIVLHVLPMPVGDIGPGVYCPGIYLARDLTGWEATQKKDSLRRLRELVPPDAELRSQPEYAVSVDPLPDAILDIAEDKHADLIVMGASPVRAARVASHAPWALTHEVICGAGCPVLTVRR